MKTKHISPESKSGGALLMAMLVMLAFTFLAVGLFHMSTTNAIETAYTDHSKQAFWVAESGLQDAIQRLRYDSNLRLSAWDNGSETFTEEDTASGIRYDVTINKAGGERYFEKLEFDVDSVGWKNNMNRRIRQRVSTRPGFFSAIMAPNDIHVQQNTLVNGPIAVLDGGTLKLDDKIPPGQTAEGDFDTIILGDGASIDRRSGAVEGQHYTTADLPSPELPEPPDGYHGLIGSAVGSTNPPPALDFDFNNYSPVPNIAVDVFFDIPGGITLNTISGSGRIINTGPITITDKDTVANTDVSSDVGLVSGGYVPVGRMNDFSGDTLLYAENYDGVGTDGYVIFDDFSIASQKSVILAQGEDSAGNGITLGGHSQFEGIIYAVTGSIEIEQGSNGSETRIVGTVISGDGVDMGQNSEIVFDYTVFNDELFDLTLFFKTETIAITRTWEELPPL